MRCAEFTGLKADFAQRMRAGGKENEGEKHMGKYILKRVLLMFLTMFIIMTMSFILIKLLPLPAVREMGRDVNLILAKREK